MKRNIFKKLTKTLITITCVVTGINFLLSSCSSSDVQERNNSLIVGLQSGYPPYEFVDDKGNVVGFDVDVGQRIAEMMGKTLVVQQMSFESLILALKQKKIDLIISGMSVTPQRLEEIAMVPYYGENVTSLSLLFWKNIPKGIFSIDDIQSMPSPSIAVQSGTFQEQNLHKYSWISPKPLENMTDLIMDIKYGKSAAALVEFNIGKELSLKHPEIEIMDVPLAPSEQVLGNGIGIHKERTELIDAVQGCVSKLKASGEMQILHQKWFKGDL